MDDSNDEIIIPKNKLKKLNVIRQLKEYKEKSKITKFLEEFNKKQENDYFLTQNNIKMGKITPFNKKKLYDEDHNLIPYSYVGPSQLFNSNSSKRPTILRSNSIMKYRSNISITAAKKGKDSHQINRHTIIDNKHLKNYFNEIRKRISEEKSKKEDRYQLLLKLPSEVQKSLINQEKFFKRTMNNKKDQKKLQEKIKVRCHKKSINDLLINKNKYFDKKYQNYTIIEKNISEENKYKNNLWNITLRNLPINGKYEKVGYMNIGNNYQPWYTFFNINRTIEYFNNPRYERNKTEENKNSKLYSSLNEDNFDLKLKSNLNLLDSIKNLEICGKNLLDVEDKRESEIKGKKILYKRHDLDSIYLRQEKYKTRFGKDFSDRIPKLNLDNIYEDRIIVENYNTNKFNKNVNLNSKYSNNLYKLS